MSDPTTANTAPQIAWLDDSGTRHTARWRSLAGHPAPARVQAVGDELAANEAYRLLNAGTALLWLGDYQGGHHLLQALGRRVDARLARQAGAPSTPVTPAAPITPLTRATPTSRASARTATTATAPATPAALKQAFFAQRQAQAMRARILGGLLLPFDADHGVPLRRAPDLRQPGLQAHGVVAEHYVASLRELLGLVGAFEWRKRGVRVRALGTTIHPHHGVFSPVRGEYVDLVAQAPLPPAAEAQGAFDIGTGTAVLALVLAKRGLRVTATDLSAAALACAADNVGRLGLADSITLLSADLFPEGRAGLVVCNPPWLPAAPSSPLEAAVYDPDSAMLRGFLAGLAAHLAPGGEGWLLLSDLAEHLGLRSRDELLGWIAAAGLQVLGRIDTRPRHRKVADTSDPLHAARAAELTSLWRLGAA